MKTLWKKKKVIMNISKRLIDFILQRYTNSGRAEGGKHRTGRYLACQGKKIKTLSLGFKLRKMVEKNTSQVTRTRDGRDEGEKMKERRKIRQRIHVFWVL